jgi:LacI family transcriptional regulator
MNISTRRESAQLAGVSRGTVDRVLNKRGSVDPEKERKIHEIAKALNYSPNLAGKTLAVRKKQLRFGYILFGSTASNPFFLDVVRGIERRAEELKDFGVSVDIRYVEQGNAEAQAELIGELAASGIAGLAITPINHPTVAASLRELGESGMPVVTVNSDLPDCCRLAYVGSDYFKSGETAAGVMNLVCAGKAKVGVVSGSPLVLCHSERVAGFTRRIGAAYPGIKIAAACANNDDDIQSYLVTRKMLEENPQLDALFLTAAGVSGACRAVADLGLKGKIAVVSYDVTAASRPLIQSGEIAAVITQEPYEQGSKPLDILLDIAGMGISPEKELHYTGLGIVIKENI